MQMLKVINTHSSAKFQQDEFIELTLLAYQDVVPLDPCHVRRFQAVPSQNTRSTSGQGNVDMALVWFEARQGREA